MSELTLYQQHAVMPVMDIQQAVARRKAIIDFTRSVMVDSVHFGKVPGTDKNTLLKPGAEMLTTFFGLSPRFVSEEKMMDWTGTQHDGEPFFHFQYRCQLWRGDLLVGEGLGSCNSWERKYRYRRAAIACPNCGAGAISKSRYPPRGSPQGTPPGWWCRDCKADFAHDDTQITEQEQGQVRNPDPADLVNTIDKMAQKRALVAATLIAVNASEFFTQDLEDLADPDVVEGTYEPTPPPTTTTTSKPKPKAKPTQQATNGKGVTLKSDAMKALLDAGLAENPQNAAHMVNLSHVLTNESTTEQIVSWATTYRTQRDLGSEAPDAAKFADDALAVPA